MPGIVQHSYQCQRVSSLNNILILNSILLIELDGRKSQTYELMMIAFMVITLQG